MPRSLAELLGDEVSSGTARGNNRKRPHTPPQPPWSESAQDDGDEDSWQEVEQSGTPWRKSKRVCPASGSGKDSKASSRIDYSSLTAEQARVMEAVVEGGESCFFTGAAGSGKSFLLRAIVQRLRDAGRRNCTFVTGTTGIAACNVGGTTIHSFSGVGFGSEGLAEMVAAVERSSHAKKRWRTCRTLVLDEVSMMDGAFFEKLAAGECLVLPPAHSPQVPPAAAGTCAGSQAPRSCRLRLQLLQDLVRLVEILLLFVPERLNLQLEVEVRVFLDGIPIFVNGSP